MSGLVPHDVTQCEWELGASYWFQITVNSKNAVFWDVTSCGSCKNKSLGGMYSLHHRGDKNRRAKKNVSSNYQLKHAICLLLLTFLARLLFSPWWWRRYTPPKWRSYKSLKTSHPRWHSSWYLQRLCARIQHFHMWLCLQRKCNVIKYLRGRTFCHKHHVFRSL
jgi:hypothetical protein